MTTPRRITPKMTMTIIINLILVASLLNMTHCFIPNEIRIRGRNLIAHPFVVQVVPRRSLFLLMQQGNDDENDDTSTSSNSSSSSSEEEDKEKGQRIFYNDFDFEPGSTTTSSSIDIPFENKNLNNDDEIKISSLSALSSATSKTNNDEQLSKLLSNSKQMEQEDNLRIAKNWSMGNWKVRGFSLDKYNPNNNNNNNNNNDHDNANDNNDKDNKDNDTDTKAATATGTSSSTATGGATTTNNDVHVCKIAFDETIQGFNDVAELIAVGRTDGSVYIIQLGSEYITKFTAISSSSSSSSSLSSSSPSDASASSSNKDNSTNEEQIELIRNDALNNEEIISTPFEILHQFYTNERKESIASLLFYDELLYTSSGNSGEIQVWSLDESSLYDSSNTSSSSSSSNTSSSSSSISSSSSSSSERTQRKRKVDVIPIHNLKNGHGDEVIVMKTLSNKIIHAQQEEYNNDDYEQQQQQQQQKTINVNDHNLLLSASIEGSFALWSRDDGDLVYRCQLTDDYGQPVSITCADVDTSAEEHFIYFGLSSGMNLIMMSISVLLFSKREISFAHVYYCLVYVNKYRSCRLLCSFRSCQLRK